MARARASLEGCPRLVCNLAMLVLSVASSLISSAGLRTPLLACAFWGLARGGGSPPWPVSVMLPSNLPVAVENSTSSGVPPAKASPGSTAYTPNFLGAAAAPRVLWPFCLPGAVAAPRGLLAAGYIYPLKGVLLTTHASGAGARVRPFFIALLITSPRRLL